MTWTTIPCGWRSLVPAHTLDSPEPPFAFVTPETPWSYGAISEILPADHGRFVRVRMAAGKGRVSAALSVPNGSRFLTSELELAPEDGEQDLHFELSPADGPACIVVRDCGEGFSTGRVLACDIGDWGDMVPGEDRRTAGPAAVVDAAAVTLDPANVASADEAMTPVSLGNSCETKLQICRALQYRFRSDVSLLAFRLLMSPPERSRDIFGWDLFDWQGTPTRTLLYYFEKDFQRLYEREDLVTDGRVVINRRSGAEHSHDYEVLKRTDEPITDALLDSGYAKARIDFEAMVAGFRRRLSEPGPFLYIHVCEGFPTEYLTRLLLRHLASQARDHRFHLLLVGFEDEDQDLTALSDRVTKAYRPRPRPHVNAFDWGDDYETWDKALGPFRLVMPQIAAPAGGA